MVRACCEKVGLKKGTWSAEEDRTLVNYIQRFGHGNWRTLPKQAGLLRCGKSCRFRWLNYLRPDIKRGNYSKEEEKTIIELHQLHGNRWSFIAASLPGRTDNEVKNYWHTHLKKRKTKNQAMVETKQPSIEMSESSTNKEKEFQPISFHPKVPVQMILENPNCSSSILSSNNCSSTITSNNHTEIAVDKFMESETAIESGGSFSSQALLAELFNPLKDFPSTFEDARLQFPLSPPSFGEYDYLGCLYNSEMDFCSESLWEEESCLISRVQAV